MKPIIILLLSLLPFGAFAGVEEGTVAQEVPAPAHEEAEEEAAASEAGEEAEQEEESSEQE